ncbi:MAG: alpha/beta fold hydrolase [bacterium]|nr:alpha/beta fold hydrolase [bacterium]
MQLIIPLALLALVIALLATFQRRLIYFPRSYPSELLMALDGVIDRIEYETVAGRQTCFYVPPLVAPERPPETLWMVFGGNGSLALDWLGMIDNAPRNRVGYLLIDYPGFGLCEGRATRQSILDSSERSLTALAARLRCRAADFDGRLNLLGHSMGAAAALQLAPRHAVRRIVLLSPFTSLLAMARRSVGWPLCLMLLDRFDNTARLNELAARRPRPEVILFHGAADEIVPVEMSRALAATHRPWIEYHELPATDHNSIAASAQGAILASMFADKT